MGEKLGLGSVWKKQGIRFLSRFNQVTRLPEVCHAAKYLFAAD
jgi:hypothetical protein